MNVDSERQGHIAPFPFASLESVRSVEVVAAARLRRVATDFVDLTTLTSVLSELLSERVAISKRGHHAYQALVCDPTTLGVTLALAEAGGGERRVYVAVESALGAAVVARALRQKAPRIVDTSRAPSPALTGAFAAVLVAALRRAHANVVPKVVAANAGEDVAKLLQLGDGSATTTSFRVLLGSDAFEAHVTVPEALVLRARSAALTPEALAKLDDATLTLSLVLGSTMASQSDLNALRIGDVFLPTGLQLHEHKGSLLGALALVSPTSERGLVADLTADQKLVIRRHLATHLWVQEKAMPSEPSAITATEALEEAPVVVRVELGTVSMTAREWASLETGDVVSLGRRIGDPAILRVAGREFARGELVQIDGDYGVRILARTESKDGGQ